MAIHYELRQAEPDVTVAALSGQLNLGNRLMEFEHAIKQRIQEGARKMIFDLSALSYIDSAGLGMVATCAGLMVKSGGKLVVSARGRIMQMFEITRLNQVIKIYPDFETALAAISDAKASNA